MCSSRNNKILVYLTDDIKERHLPTSLRELRGKGVEYRFIPLDLKPKKLQSFLIVAQHDLNEEK